MKITTMTEALSLVPEYWPLVPGVDKWRDGDEYFTRNDASGWRKFEHNSWQMLGEIGGTISHPVARRAIPQSVREAEARWILYSALAAVAPLAEWDKLPAQFILTVYGCTDEGDVHLDIESEPQFNGLRSFDGQEAAYKAIKVLGGEQAVIQMLTEGPGALWRWVAEMRGNQ